MKKKYLFLLIVIGFLFTNCQQNEPYQSSPALSLPNGSIWSFQKDTIVALKTVQKQYVLDTISIGDTILFSPHINGFNSKINEFHIYTSKKEVAVFIWPELNGSISNSEEGRFVVNGDFSELTFQFLYIPKIADKDVKLIFEIQSDAPADIQNFKTEIKTPIKEPLIDADFQLIADSLNKAFNVLGMQKTGYGKIPQQIEYIKQKAEDESITVKMTLNFAESTSKKIIYDFIESREEEENKIGFIEISAGEEDYTIKRWYFIGEGEIKDYNTPENFESEGYCILNNLPSQINYSFFNNSSEIQYEGTLTKAGKYAFKNTIKTEEETETPVEKNYTKAKVTFVNKLPE